MARNSERKITGTGQFVTVDGEKIKVGLLDHAKGNARIVPTAGGSEIKGIFGLVQWYRRGEPLEKIAYNVTATSIQEAGKEMAAWIPRLQFPEYRESSELIKIVEI